MDCDVGAVRRVHGRCPAVLPPRRAAAGGIPRRWTRAASTGAAWPLLAPAVGALGTFITGSATASNLLFTEFQETTAVSAGFDPLPLLGAQNSGAAIGNIICPHNVVAAAATVGLSGREGEVLRRTLPVAAIALVVSGGFAFLIT